MPINLSTIQRGGVPRPPILLVYGTKGIGKTTLGAKAPSPVFLSLEDGMTSIDAPYWRIKEYSEIADAIDELLSEAHDFQTLVVDSLDWMEPIVWAQTCRLNNWKTIETPGYQKGYKAAANVWRGIFDGFTMLRDQRKMGIIMLAHPEVRRFDSPETDPYDRYQLKIHKEASALAEECADAVLFANYKVATTKTDVGWNKSVVRGVGTGERVLYTEARPSHNAKNRYGMPATLPLEWKAVAKFIPFYATEPSTQPEQGTRNDA